MFMLSSSQQDCWCCVCYWKFS